MKIAFDHTIFLLQKYGGVTRYFCQIFNSLKKKHKTKILSPFYQSTFLKYYNKDVIKIKNINSIPKYTTKLLNYINLTINNSYLKVWKPDIIHKTYYNEFTYNFINAKKILNVWDLSHEIYHHMYNKPSSWRPKKNSLKNVDHIICSSKKTQNDLINFYDVDLDKTSVIYQGTPLLQDSHNNLDIDYKFFLYVGSRKKYKNFELLLKTFSLNKSFLKDFKLVCFGEEKFNNDEMLLINKHNISKHKIKLFSGGDHTLVSLYKKAEALIYPSLNEGFGFPPLEAMKFGCSVVTSNNLAIQEAVDNCGFYFDPNDENSLAKSLEKLLNSKDEKEIKKINGLKRSNFFNWDKTSKDLIEVYKKVLI